MDLDKRVRLVEKTDEFQENVEQLIEQQLGTIDAALLRDHVKATEAYLRHNAHQAQFILGGSPCLYRYIPPNRPHGLPKDWRFIFTVTTHIGRQTVLLVSVYEDS